MKDIVAQILNCYYDCSTEEKVEHNKKVAEDIVKNMCEVMQSDTLRIVGK